MIFVVERSGAGCYNASVMPKTSATESTEVESLRQENAQAGTPEPSAPPAGTGASAPSGYIYIRREVIFPVAIAVAFAVGLGGGYLIWGTSKAASEAQPTDTGVSRPAGRIEISLDDDPRLGPDDAPITIVEFSDFNCPFCRAWHQQTFPGLLETFPDQILFVYKDFPVVGGGTIGEGAALAANCAAEQEGYWPYHDALFSGEFGLDRAGFEQAAIGTGLDGEALLSCLDSGRYADEVQEDLRYGAGLGVTGTPTFFINGIPMVGAQPLLRFIEVINGELGGS